MVSVLWRSAKSAASVCALIAGLAIGGYAAQAQQTMDSDQGTTTSTGDDGDLAETVILRTPARSQTKITVEGLVLQRDDITTIPLTTQRLGATGVPDARPFIPLDTSVLDPETGVGLRASLITELFGIPLELTGFYAGDMLTRFAQGGLEVGNTIRTGAIYIDNIPIEAGNFVGVDPRYSRQISALTVEHQTQIWSAEINTPVLWDSGLFVGARAINLRETFSSATASRNIDFPLDPGFSGNRIDNALIEADNKLFGLQIGIDHMFGLGHGIEIGGTAKAGVYANYYDRLRLFTSQSPPGVASCPECQRNRIRDTVEDTGLATAIELNPRLNIQLDDGVALTASGMFLWIDGISEATSYFDRVATRTDKSNDNDGDIFLYGGTVGLTFSLGEDAPAAERGLSLKDSASASAPHYHIPASPEELDERIADLEATTARKGNRVVSLNLTGQINKMLLWYRDGEISDVYVVDNTSSPSRFYFDGSAQISRSWSAGFEVGFDAQRSIRSSAVSQFVSQLDDPDLRLRDSTVWLDHNRYGRITLGQGSPATDDIILYNLGGTSAAASADIRLIGGGMAFRRAQRPDEDLQGPLVAPIQLLTVNRLAGGLDTDRRQGVRYDTPSYYGFFASTFWGEDDFWDVALRWRRSWQDWRWRVGVGYLENTSFDGADRKETEWKGSASVLHIPSGLFASGAFLRREFEGTDPRVQTSGFVTAPGSNLPAFEYWYVQSGIRKNWSGAGDTSVFGEYAETSDAASGRDSFGFDEITDSNMYMIGAGVVQTIDKISSEIYLGYRRFDSELRGVRNGAPEFEEFDEIDLVYSGMRIRF